MADSKSAGGKSSLNIPTLCVYPWMEQVVQSTGKISFCCVAKNGGNLRRQTVDGPRHFHASEDRLADAWNSDHMRSIRKGMLAGEKVPGCELCYFQESIGKRSYREMHNEEWINRAGDEIQRRIEESKLNDFNVKTPAMYLDLRLGNLCNLKCRSCNSYNSSQIHRETSNLIDTDPEYAAFYERHNGPGKPPSFPNWFESDAFWDEVIESIPNLSKVYLTGGEPTLIEKNYKFMQACIDSGHARNIFLMFNINCTNVQDRFLEYLPHFQFVLINASIDGFGPANEYLRHLSRWETVDKNFRRLASLPKNVQIGVTPVVQVYNILSITDLLDYIEKVSMEHHREINVDFLYATGPNYINAQILPHSIKEEAIRRLEAYKRRSTTYGSQRFLQNSVDSCINMLSDQPAGDEAKIHDFVQYTRLLDKHRKQSLEHTFPELAQRLEQEGYLANV